MCERCGGVYERMQWRSEGVCERRTGGVGEVLEAWGMRVRVCG
jgi:hypothetical protein